MKHQIKFLSLIACLSAAVALSSCDDDDEAPKNQFSVDGESYSLQNGYHVVTEEGVDDNGDEAYTHVVYLTDADLEWEEDDGELFTDGEGSLVGLEFVLDSDELEEGEYDLDLSNYEVGNVTYLDAATEYSAIDGVVDYDKFFRCMDGTVTISKSDNGFIFEVTNTSVEDEDGDEVDGELKVYFKGELEELDE